MSKKKEVLLRNGKFSWYLEVDGHTIPFTGSYNANYFETHYKSLGYTVTIKDENEEEN